MSELDQSLTPELARRLCGIRGVVFDVDGCLVLSDNPGGHGGLVLPGAAAAIDEVRRGGRRVVVFTNASSQIPADLAASLRSLGLDLSTEDVMTPSVVAAEVILERYGDRPILAFGGTGVVDVLVDAGVQLAALDDPTSAAAVVVGWDTAFDRDKLQAAAEAVWNGADLLVTSDARRFASRTKPMAGVGGFIAQGLSYVTDTDYEVLGKPSPMAMAIAARKLGCSPAEVLVAGDDLVLEVSMARSAGGIGVLVTTGMHSAADAERLGPDMAPHLVVDGLPQLMSLLTAAAKGAVGEVA